MRKDSLRCHISQHKKQGMRGVVFVFIKVADPMIGCDSKKQLSNQILSNDDLTFYFIYKFFVSLYLQYFCSVFDVFVSRHGKM